MDKLPTDLQRLILQYVPNEPLKRCVECKVKDVDNSTNFAQDYDCLIYKINICVECHKKRYCCATCKRRHVYDSRFYPR